LPILYSACALKIKHRYFLGLFQELCQDKKWLAYNHLAYLVATLSHPMHLRNRDLSEELYYLQL
jgi:hypothetical protein